MKVDCALVLNRNEFEAFICRYNKHIDQVIEHINAIDASWGERISISRLEPNEKMFGLNLCECAFLPCHISSGVSELHFEEYDADETECEILIRQGKNLIWRELNGQDIIALFLPEAFSCYSEAAYVEAFRDLVGQYLPTNFNFASHIGPLRVRSSYDNAWCFERADAETYVKTLLGINGHNIISIADTDDDMELPF